MIEQFSLQTVLTYLTLISVPIGVFYHIMTLRNTRKNQQLTLETRQAQLMMNITQELTSSRRWREYLDVLYHTDWTDYDDFQNKYGRNNPEAYSKILSLWWAYNSVGTIIEEGLLEERKVDLLMGTMVIQQWEKWESVIKALREDIGAPKAFDGFELLYERVQRLTAPNT